jgi:hypothetical protein
MMNSFSFYAFIFFLGLSAQVRFSVFVHLKF